MPPGAWVCRMPDPLHVLITGGGGQVGLELQAAPWPAGVVLHAPSRAELDLTDPATVRAVFAVTPFSVVINTAAYTAVDRAETAVATAFAVNGTGPAILADMTREASIPLIQVSTDYVFDGAKGSPYVEADPVSPLGVYGASKLAGELAVRTGNARSVVLRTAWVLSVHRTNFLKTMLRLASERPCLRVVGDQHGCPTSARDIASALQTIALKMVADPRAPTGVYHFVNGGATSWANLATEIFRLSAAAGGPAVGVETISSCDYPTLAQRPKNSRLLTDKLTRDYGIEPRSWQLAVAEIVNELCAERVFA